jgi:hypothetical protein
MNNYNATTEEFNPMQSITIKNFVAIWKNISNSPRIKPTFVEKKGARYNYKTRKTKIFTYKEKIKGFIYPEHHILYNMVRGLPLSRGFGVKTPGYKTALDFFTNNKNKEYYNKKLYEPFKESMTMEEFEKILTEAKKIAKI